MLKTNLKIYDFASKILYRNINFSSKWLKAAYHFDYERVKGTENAKWLHLTGKKSMEMYIPVTRKMLLKRIFEDDDLVEKSAIQDFQHLATRLDSAVTLHYKRKLETLKSLYNPISPDRDTVQMKFFTNNELIDREKDLLHLLTKLLREARFYQLPNEVMLEAIGEENVGEKVVFAVSPNDYDVLKFWVIGMDVAPLDDRPWYVIAGERARAVKERATTALDPLSKYNYKRSLAIQGLSRIWTKLYGKNVRRIARYKRVIVVLREKGEPKLKLKSFKDIPCENLEFLLPVGKIKMGKLDKIKLVLQSGFFVLFILATAITNLTEMKMEMNLILGLATLFILARNIAIYKNMRNKCILQMSQTLYFKSVANHHALLPLIVDRAEDETFKSLLLIYAFLHETSWSANLEKHAVWKSENALQEQVQDWLSNAFQVAIKFEARPALEKLLDWKVVTVMETDGERLYKAAPMDHALNKLPNVKRTPMLHHADLLDITIGRASSLPEEHEEAYLDFEHRFDWW